jgi:hypothetical protein
MYSTMTRWRILGVLLLVFGVFWGVYSTSNERYGGIANPLGWYGWVFYGSNLALSVLCFGFGALLTWEPGRRSYR